MDRIGTKGVKSITDEVKDTQPSSTEELSSMEGENVLAMKVPVKDSSSRETEDKISAEEVGRLKELIGKLKGSLIDLNKGIVVRQETIEELKRRKQKLLEHDKDPSPSEGLAAMVIDKPNARMDLVEDPLARDAIKVFPEEVWELILMKLTDPQDLRNCSTSCQLFDRILHPLKQNFLFLGVFPHLCPYLDNDLILSCRRVCKGWNEGVDNFVENHPARLPRDKVGWNPRFPPPTTNGIFRVEFSNKPGDLRELNFLKKMRRHPRNPFVGRAVSIRVVDQDATSDDDSFFGGDSDNENDGDGFDDDEDGLEQDLYQFADGENLVHDSFAEENDDDHDGDDSEWSSFTEQSDDSDDDEGNWDTDGDSYVGGDGPLTIGISPNFLPRNEAIGIPVDQQKRVFWQGLLNFLEIFGKHIWYLSFKCMREGSFIINEDSVFRFLAKRIFLLAPNLRTFQINGCLPRPNRPMLGPPPVAPKLETLQIERYRRRWRYEDLPKGSVTDTLIHASFQHLKQLRVDWANWKHVFKSNLEWSNLTELYINNDGLGGAINAKHIVPCRMPHLRKIGFAHIGWDFEWDGENRSDLDFQEIIKIIIGLSARTNLHVLQLFNGIQKEQILNAPIRLFAHPHLKTLEMNHPSLSGDYDYTLLLRFPFLENLVIFHYGNDYSKMCESRLERQIVEMEPYMSLGRIYECEIWELLPHLKNFTVQRDEFIDIGEGGKYISTSSMYTRECYERIMSRKKKSLGNDSNEVK